MPATTATTAAKIAPYRSERDRGSVRRSSWISFSWSRSRASSASAVLGSDLGSTAAASSGSNWATSASAASSGLGALHGDLDGLAAAERREGHDRADDQADDRDERRPTTTSVNEEQQACRRRRRPSSA